MKKILKGQHTQIIEFLLYQHNCSTAFKSNMQINWKTSSGPLTHPVESMAVVAPVVPLYQHLSQAVGMMWLGAHCCHAPLDEALHLRLAYQTSAKSKGLKCDDYILKYAFVFPAV